MNDIIYLARSKAVLVWLLLVGATGASWWLGVHSLPGIRHAEGAVGAVVIAIALVKVRFVAMYFMEVRHAPTTLRWIIEAYCAVVLAVLVSVILIT